MDSLTILKYVLYADDISAQGVTSLLADVPLGEQLEDIFFKGEYKVNKDRFTSDDEIIAKDRDIFYIYEKPKENNFENWQSWATKNPVAECLPDIIIKLQHYDEVVKIWFINTGNHETKD